MSHPRLAPFKLDVIVVGGGQYYFPSCLACLCLASLAIAGLSMALGLALSGHTVRVLEKSETLGTTPGGIRLPPNVTKILVQWGLADELRERGSLVRGGTHIWDCKIGNHSDDPPSSVPPFPFWSLTSSSRRDW